MSEKIVSEELAPDVAEKQADKNHLFPVFLKLEGLEVLLVGAGKVAMEKLSAIIANAPATSITVVGTEIAEAVKEFAGLHHSIRLIERPFEPEDLDDKDIVVVAVNDKSASNYIRVLAKQKKLLVNVADTPELCDFYLAR